MRNSPIGAILIAVVFFAGTKIGPPLLVDALQPLLFSATIFSSGVVTSLIVAAVKAVFSGYVALVLAKSYGDASYGRFPRY
ncbi:MAG: hypothetical protein IAI49_06545 [Candidatus Eremiobacteraeota bacterium]|nr:hypothetical protein [Candidatus Eremiobacteraeota bacterium]